jgi:hypothetical protein
MPGMNNANNSPNMSKKVVGKGQPQERLSENEYILKVNTSGQLPIAIPSQVMLLTQRKIRIYQAIITIIEIITFHLVGLKFMITISG